MTRDAGITVALVGADGSGKTSVARALRVLKDPSLRIEYVYLGSNPSAATHSLPTTRAWRWCRRRFGGTDHVGGPPRLDVDGPKRRSVFARAYGAAKEWTGMTLRVGEEWYRQWIAWRLSRKGIVVVFDRHYYWDYYAHDIQPDKSVSLARRFHGWMLATKYPKPRHVILLDAPPEVLHARKDEGTLEEVARRRDEYVDLARGSKSVRVIDTTQPFERVLDEVVLAIKGWSRERV